MDAETLLQRSGWFPGRRIDVAGDLAFIRSEGFAATPAAERFLEEYSGLVISWETHRNPLVLSGSEAARGVDAGWCEAYSEAIGLVLSPVGVYSHMTLYVDPSGGLWGGFDREYGQVGSLLDVVRETFLEPPRPFDRLLDSD
jgi:hypothetical protein